MFAYSIFDPSSLCMCHLTSGWNEFRKVPYFSQVILVQLEPSLSE